MKKIFLLFLLIPNMVFAAPIAGNITLVNGTAVIVNKNIKTTDVAMGSLVIPKGVIANNYTYVVSSKKLTITAVNGAGGMTRLDDSTVSYAIFNKGE